MQFIYKLINILSLLIITTVHANDLQDISIENYFYLGTIGNKYSIQMELKHDTEVNAWNGQYFYVKKDNFNTPINLDIEMQSLNLKLSEFIEQGENKIVTGYFNGAFDDLNMQTATGEWKSTNNKLKLPFNLTQIAQYHQRKNTRDFNYKYNVDESCPCHDPIMDKNNFCTCRAIATVTYPVFNSFSSELLTNILDNNKLLDTNITVDQESTENGNEYPNAGESSTNITVAFYAMPLISLKIDSYIYNWGAAHPMNFNNGINLHVNDNGKVTELKLKDLMITNKKCLNKLDKAIIADLSRQQASFIDEASDVHSKSFIIHPGGLEFLFSPYEVGSYAEGNFEAKVPWSKIQTCIPETSLLTKLME